MKTKLIFIIILIMGIELLCFSESSVNTTSYISEKELIEQVISEDILGVKNRKSAIKYFEKKVSYLNFDNNGNLYGFDSSIPVGMNDNDLKYLVFFPELSAIHLSDKNISDKFLYYLQRFKKIESISLINTKVTGIGFRYLADNKDLNRFDFNNSPITDEGLKYLSQIEYKNPIIGLYLDNSKVTDAGMPYIAKMKFDQGRISLDGTAVTDKGIKHLAGFKNMIEIFLYNTKVTDKGGKWLEAQLPNTTVYWGKRKPQNDDEY